MAQDECDALRQERDALQEALRKGRGLSVGPVGRHDPPTPEEGRLVARLSDVLVAIARRGC